LRRILQISTLLGLGLTQDQVVAMVERFPGTLQTSCASLEAKIRFLTEDMGRSVDELVSYPAFISLSLRQRVSLGLVRRLGFGALGFKLVWRFGGLV
jgi:hypothetical protein